MTTGSHGFTSFVRLAASAVVLALLAACGGGGSSTPSPVPDTSPPINAASLPTCTATISVSAPLTDITTIQGATVTSSMVGQTVTVRGVVVGEFQNQTKTQLNGFFIQQAVPDADPLTSEGLFVFAPTATVAKVTAGDYVQVQGLVAEFGDVSNPVTQLSGAVTVSTCATGIAVKPTNVNLPNASLETLERYEGMLVQFPQTLAVTEMFELDRFGVMVLSLNGRQFNATNGNFSVTSAQNKLARITLDDGVSRSNPNPIPYFSAAGSAGQRRMGDTVQNLKGILTQGLGTANVYRVHPTVAPVFIATTARTAAAPAVNGTLKVSSFNVLNYFTTLTSASSNARGADTAAEFERQKAKIVEAIAGINADVLGLIEIENNNDLATNDLVAALNTKMGTGTYAAINSGVIGTDFIKVDILYKPSKVKRIGGFELPTGTDLANYTAVSGRPPLAQRFATLDNNGGFWFVVNHFKSKNCGTPAPPADLDVGQGCFNLARTAQANALNSFVTKLKAQGENDVLIMGDINSYLTEDPTVALESAGNESLLKRMPAADRYTYVFGGETGALDHAYASSTLKSQVSGIGVWHINSDEPAAIDYNTVIQGTVRPDDRYAATPYRASDHDPVIVGLSLTADAVVNLPVLSVNLPAASVAGGPYTATVVEASPGGSATLASLAISWGDSTPDTSLSSAISSTHTYAAVGTYTVVVTLTNSAAQTVSKSAVVTVSAGAVVVPPGPAGAQDLFFSEYIEGNSNNKALEIYNPTTQTVNLSSYVVKLFSNGATTSQSSLTLTGTLAPGGVVVIVNNSATATFKTVPGFITSSVTNFNGNDAVTLEKSGVVIDRFGQVGMNPDTANPPPIGWSGGGVQTSNSTLRRKPSIKTGDNNASGAFDPSVQWVATTLDDATGLGAHTIDP
jgi:uncharacterized protein